MYKITIKAEFNAAHKLRDYSGKCEGLHGHNWAVEAVVGSKKLDKVGMAIDFTCLKKEMYLFLEQLDHKYLNELRPFKKNNPTSENIAKFIYDGMKKICKKYKVKPVKAVVWETPTSCASYDED